MPNLIPDLVPWLRPAGRLIWFTLITFIGIAIVVALMRRKRDPRDTTWAQAAAGAVGVTFLMFMAYGVVPHEFITFSDLYLGWTTDRILLDTYPLKVNYQALRDILVVGIYLFFFALNLAIFVMWQKQGDAKPAAADAPTKRSRFGRPLRKQA